MAEGASGFHESQELGEATVDHGQELVDVVWLHEKLDRPPTDEFISDGGTRVSGEHNHRNRRGNSRRSELSQHFATSSVGQPIVQENEVRRFFSAASMPSRALMATLRVMCVRVWSRILTRVMLSRSSSMYNTVQLMRGLLPSLRDAVRPHRFHRRRVRVV